MNWTDTTHWLTLAVVVAVLLTIDLLIFNKPGKEPSMRRSVLESVLWIVVGLGFSGFVWATGNQQVTIEYLTAYLIEKSLSADNLFVFAALFEYFHIQGRYQHRVLFLGILGALALRFIFIFAGITLIQRFEWLVYLLGGLLIVTGARLGWQALKHQESQPGENAIVRAVAKVVPVDRHYQGKEFWYRSKTGICLTPLALALIAIESSDVMFAVDSVPAVLAVTRDPFIAYSSNAFAILGLRALYFVLAGAMRELPLIRPMLSLILMFVGVKMLIAHYVDLPAWIPLLVVGALLAAAVLGSLKMRRRSRENSRQSERAA